MAYLGNSLYTLDPFHSRRETVAVRGTSRRPGRPADGTWLLSSQPLDLTATRGGLVVAMLESTWWNVAQSLWSENNSRTHGDDLLVKSLCVFLLITMEPLP